MLHALPWTSSLLGFRTRIRLFSLQSVRQHVCRGVPSTHRGWFPMVQFQSGVWASLRGSLALQQFVFREKHQVHLLLHGCAWIQWVCMMIPDNMFYTRVTWFVFMLKCHTMQQSQPIRTQIQCFYDFSLVWYCMGLSVIRTMYYFEFVRRQQVCVFSGLDSVCVARHRRFAETLEDSARSGDHVSRWSFSVWFVHHTAGDISRHLAVSRQVRYDSAGEKTPSVCTEAGRRPLWCHHCGWKHCRVPTGETPPTQSPDQRS